MIQIEGQTLLSIHQYIPTDCIKMAKKSDAMMNIIIENISDKIRKGIMDYDLEFPSLEIRGQDQPFFTITAEEVEEINRLIYDHCRYLKNWGYVTTPKTCKKRLRITTNLLARIKQWKDEQANKNKKSLCKHKRKE